MVQLQRDVITSFTPVEVLDIIFVVVHGSRRMGIICEVYIKFCRFGHHSQVCTYIGFVDVYRLVELTFRLEPRVDNDSRYFMRVQRECSRILINRGLPARLPYIAVGLVRWRAEARHVLVFCASWHDRPPSRVPSPVQS